VTIFHLGHVQFGLRDPHIVSGWDMYHAWLEATENLLGFLACWTVPRKNVWFEVGLS